MREFHSDGYGIVHFKTKEDIKNDGYDPERDPRFRKITAIERREIFLNLIKISNGKPMRLGKVAYYLGVTKRTMQGLVKQLVKENIISVTPRFGKTGKQKANLYTYLGEDKEVSPGSLTIEDIFDGDNKAGFRDWDWWYYKFIPGLYEKDFTKEMAYIQYMCLLNDKKRIQKLREEFRNRK